jgi:hypothetical protein
VAVTDKDGSVKDSLLCLRQEVLCRCPYPQLCHLSVFKPWKQLALIAHSLCSHGRTKSAKAAHSDQTRSSHHVALLQALTFLHQNAAPFKLPRPHSFNNQRH